MKQKTQVTSIIFFLLFTFSLLLSPFRLLAQQRSVYDLAAWIIAATGDNDTTTINWALKEGGQIDFKRAEMNALHLAIQNGKPNMVKFLLEKGASLDSVNAGGLTGLAYAEKLERVDIIQLIRRHKKMAPLPADVNKDSTLPPYILPEGEMAKSLKYKVGDTVLHSRDRGKTWEPGIIKEVSVNKRLLADGISPYLVENMAKTDQGYRDKNFITTFARQPSWTDFYTGDWDLNTGMAITERMIDRDVYQIISGGYRLPPLRIKHDGSYSWLVDKKLLNGKWQANKNQPGIVLLKGERGVDWLMYNTTDDNNQKIYKTDYIILAPQGKYYGSKHGFRIQEKK